jgi:hypothetical protein
MLVQISYDLRDHERDYDDLFEQIKRQGRWWHHLKSTWIIETEQSTRQIVDGLEQYLSRGDRLLVAEINRIDGMLPENAWRWLEKHRVVQG